MSAAAVRMPEKVKKKEKPANIRYPFWFGGSASSFAASVTHPLDLGMFATIPLSYHLQLLTTSQSRYNKHQKHFPPKH